ncbi:rapid ALkalinization factor [Fusarium mundagurra]|uniref:Rapid ALkalinization factor n=1 Tax=Fusarium mundagurra TaxID=1567541 RepID=A0A8H5YWV0_9HYPO|nr:rapid ALkalinization factor [Fusarium mundagurra]
MKFSLITTLCLASFGTAQYISYRGLRKDGTNCDLRNESWKNCRPGAYANPWSRGCEAVFHCRGTDYPPGPDSSDDWNYIFWAHSIVGLGWFHHLCLKPKLNLRGGSQLHGSMEMDLVLHIEEGVGEGV